MFLLDALASWVVRSISWNLAVLCGRVACRLSHSIFFQAEVSPLFSVPLAFDLGLRAVEGKGWVRVFPVFGAHAAVLYESERTAIWRFQPPVFPRFCSGPAQVWALGVFYSHNLTIFLDAYLRAMFAPPNQGVHAPGGWPTSPWVSPALNFSFRLNLRSRPGLSGASR